MGKAKKKEASKEPAEDSPILHHDAPAPETPKEQSALKTDAPALPKITVKIAACGLLLENELKRQKAAGLVERYGQLVLDGVLLQPDEMHAVSRSQTVEKAIVNGWIVDMGV